MVVGINLNTNFQTWFARAPLKDYTNPSTISLEGSQPLEQ